MQRWEPDGAAGARGTVARILYASEAAMAGPVYAEMEKIRASAVRNNEPAGVATALLYQSGWFVQWKEGEGEALLRVMDRVSADPRHRNLRVVHSSRGPRLLDGPWSMAIVQCAERASDMERRVLELRRQVDAGLQFGPPAVWRRLSTPMRHPGAARQQDPDVFQRVLVCAAAGIASFDLVRWLSARTGEELVHRRFAGARDLDVATDYVDFADGERVLRVIAMARNGLHLPLTRAFLPDYSHIALLLSGERERDLDLLQRVLQACARLPQPPALLAVAKDERWHAEPFALAHRAGLVYLQCVADAAAPVACWNALHPLLALWQHAANSGGLALARRASQ